jgi:branched-chain amino acid transport system permease protein
MSTAMANDVDLRIPSIRTAATPGRVISALLFLAAALFLLPAVLSAFWMQISFQWALYSAVALGLGLLVGRTGMFSLCQIPLVAAGAWFALRVNQDIDLPFPLLLLVAGLLTGLVGIVIGLPALRLSGLYLALITLMAAGAMTLLLKVVLFPNGGPGFWGFDKSRPSGAISLQRPSIATGDVAYYRYTVVVVAILFALVIWHIKGKPGRTWASIRQAHVTAVAAGVHTTLYKLWAFALSAFITGIAGALLAAGPGGVSVQQFPVEQSITLLAVVLLGGVYNVWGAIVAAFFMRVLPQILDQELGLPPELLTILFGVGVMQVLIVQPRGVVQDLTNLGRLIGRKLGLVRGTEAAPGPDTVEVSDGQSPAGTAATVSAPERAAT